MTATDTQLLIQFIGDKAKKEGHAVKKGYTANGIQTDCGIRINGIWIQQSVHQELVVAYNGVMGKPNVQDPGFMDQLFELFEIAKGREEGTEYLLSSWLIKKQWFKNHGWENLTVDHTAGWLK